jgi:hypothetical protein
MATQAQNPDSHRRAISRHHPHFSAKFSFTAKITDLHENKTQHPNLKANWKPLKPIETRSKPRETHARPISKPSKMAFRHQSFSTRYTTSCAYPVKNPVWCGLLLYFCPKRG